MMYVIKANGEKEQFDKEKIKATCTRIGLENKDCLNIADNVEKNIKNGISTHDVYKITLEEIKKIDDAHAAVFGLRDSIAEIDSVSFEIYVKKVLEANGYECKWNTLIKGKCVEHQIDIIANKEKLYMVECKWHFNPHRLCGLGIPLQINSRLEDVVDGFSSKINDYDFDFAWIITNTKFSEHSRMYSSCKKIRLTGWRSGDLSLEKLAQSAKVYPVSMIYKDKKVLNEFLSKGIVTIQDLLATKVSDEIKKKSMQLISYPPLKS